MKSGTELPAPPVVSTPLPAVAPMEPAKFPLRNRPPEVRLRVSVGDAKASVPAAIATKFSEFRLRAELPVETVPVNPVTLRLELAEDCTPEKVLVRLWE